MKIKINTRIIRLIICLVAFQSQIFSVLGQADISIGPYYQLNLQRQTDNADAFILHNAKVDVAGPAIFRWETTHPSFGSRGIRFSYFNGIEFFADALPTIAGTSFTPSPRFVVRNDGNIGIGTSSPRGKFDIDGPGDIFLADDVNAGSSQSLYVPGRSWKKSTWQDFNSTRRKANSL